MRIPSSLYGKSGLFCLDDAADPTPIELRGVEVDTELHDLCARVTVRQRYHRAALPDGEALERRAAEYDAQIRPGSPIGAGAPDFGLNPPEAQYIFPLDSRAAVCGFEVKIDGVVSVGKVEEKAAARATYADAIATGDGAQLLEQQRADIFAMTVGNVETGQTVIIKLIYVTDLRIDGDAVDFFLPTFVAPRYCSTWDPAPQKSHRRTASDPIQVDRHVRDGLFLAVTAHMASAITSVTSESHPSILVSEAAAGPGGLDPRVRVCTLHINEPVLDKDVLIKVAIADPHTPRCILEHLPNGSRAGVLTLAPQIDLDEARAELIFVVDCSGSMRKHNRIQNARRAMQLFLRSLPVDCYINVVRFGSHHTSLYPGASRKYSAQTLAEATAYVDQTNPDMGGTELLQPLTAALGSEPISGYNRQVFLLTDGKVSDSQGIITAVGRGIEVFTTAGCVSHPNIICDVSGMNPIVGLRFHKMGEMHDLCRAEFNKLLEVDRRSYEVIAEPHATPVPYTELPGDLEPMPTCRVFALGLGHGASRALVEGVARVGGGTSAFVVDAGLDEKVIDQLKTALQPALNNITIRWEGAAPAAAAATMTAAHVNPRLRSLLGFNGRTEPSGGVAELGLAQAPFVAPPVFSGTRYLAFCLLEPGASAPTSVHITANTPVGPIDLKVPVEHANAVGETGTVHPLAARALIKDIEDGSSWLHAGLRPTEMPVRLESKARREIVRLAIKHCLVSTHTSYVAIQPKTTTAAARAITAVCAKIKPERGDVSSTLSGSRASACVDTCMAASSMRGRPRKKGHGRMVTTSFELIPPSSASHSRRPITGGGHVIIGKRARKKKSREAEKSCWDADLDCFEDSVPTRHADVNTGTTTPVAFGDPLTSLCLLQTFQGSFELSEALCNMTGASFEAAERCAADFGKSSGHHTKHHDQEARSLVATALALAHLEVDLAHKQDAWQLLATKARNWMDKACTTAFERPAKDLQKAMAGMKLLVVKNDEEAKQMADTLAEELEQTLQGMQTVDSGVHVQASNLGAMKVLLEFLTESKIPVSDLNIGPVHKKDIVRASIQLERDPRYALVLAFSVPVEREAEQHAKALGIKIFTADIMCRLVDAFTKHIEEERTRRRIENAAIAIFPCRVKIMPDAIFSIRDPIILGVTVLEGQLKIGTKICVDKNSRIPDFVDLGVVRSLLIDQTRVEIAPVGREVCMEIEAVGGDKKLFGQHFAAEDELISRISRQSIDAVKAYFREDLTKPDWKLMLKLKRKFQIT